MNLVAEDTGGEVVGWACHGPYRDGELLASDTELYALLRPPDQVGHGAGQAQDNGRARRFYERAGFQADGAEEPFEVEGVRVPEVRYARALPR
ncbi:hypothetical protein QF034_006727 [Streptomyces africanus]|uniref:Acetyltransferase n=1 Tax=Streptomyces africanus TaxID=231024 RepID=A0ABU0QYL0_9ACTN|nr:hypothetical protein [Streptomyces africanus]